MILECEVWGCAVLEWEEESLGDTHADEEEEDSVDGCALDGCALDEYVGKHVGIKQGESGVLEAPPVGTRVAAIATAAMHSVSNST